MYTALAIENSFSENDDMAGRTDALTEIAKPIADRLFAHCGSLKRILSAGVLALDALPPEERERFMAAAIGARYESPQSVKAQNALIVFKEMLANTPPGDIIKILGPEGENTLRQIAAYLLPPAGTKNPPKRRIGRIERTG